MPKSQPLLINSTQDESILQVLPRLPLHSSARLEWKGIYVQQHQQPAWEMPEYAHTRHMILVHGTARVAISM